MSAGANVVQRDLDKCAPLFAKAVKDSIYICNQNGLDAFVYEALRSQELQSLYWSRGREYDPDQGWYVSDYSKIVTRVQHVSYGWHFFGLAVDVISRSKEWSVSDEWRSEVNQVFRNHGLHCGADWPHPDLPHYQWTKQNTPSDNDRSTYDKGGIEAVWKLNYAV